MTGRERRARRRTQRWSSIRHGITSARTHIRLLEMRLAAEITADQMLRPYYDQRAAEAYDLYLLRDHRRHGNPTTR